MCDASDITETFYRRRPGLSNTLFYIGIRYQQYREIASINSPKATATRLTVTFIPMNIPKRSAAGFKPAIQYMMHEYRIEGKIRTGSSTRNLEQK